MSENILPLFPDVCTESPEPPEPPDTTLKAPATRRCDCCGTWLGKRRDGVCDHCGSSYCPYCGATFHTWEPIPFMGSFSPHWGDECCHLIASEDIDEEKGWAIDPFQPDTLPHLQESLGSVAWTESDKAEAFGEYLPFLEAYENGLCRPPDGHRLLELWRRRTVVPVVRAHFFQDFGPASYSEGADYFAERPEEARAELSALTARLAEGFSRLRAAALTVKVGERPAENGTETVDRRSPADRR